jgi:hypothetical protein
MIRTNRYSKVAEFLGHTSTLSAQAELDNFLYTHRFAIAGFSTRTSKEAAPEWLTNLVGKAQAGYYNSPATLQSLVKGLKNYGLPAAALATVGGYVFDAVLGSGGQEAAEAVNLAFQDTVESVPNVDSVSDLSQVDTIVEAPKTEAPSAMDKLDSKMDSKFENLDSKMDSKFENFGKKPQPSPSQSAPAQPEQSADKGEYVSQDDPQFQELKRIRDKALNSNYN